MDWLNVGNSGLKVTQITYGTALTIGVEKTDIVECQELIDTAWNLGIRSFDTADSYGNGKSEELLGKCLSKRNREDYVLITKTGQPIGSGPFDKGLSRKHIFHNIDKSLNRLQTDYIDLYYAHRPDPDVNLEEIAFSFNDLIRQGKILYWATSEWSAESLKNLHEICTYRNLEKPIAEQAIYSYAVQKVKENDIQAFCYWKNLGLFGYSPLCQGFLTGKYKNGIPKDSRIAKADQLNYDKTKNFYEQYKNRIDFFLKTCDCFKIKPSQGALLYCLNDRILPILGASKPKQLEENLIGLFDERSDLKTFLNTLEEFEG